MDIYIIGIGMGAPENRTAEASQKIEEASLLIGAERMLAPYQGRKECFVSYKTEEIVACIEQKIGDMHKIAVLMSGAGNLFPFLFQCQNRESLGGCGDCQSAWHQGKPVAGGADT